ncbi:MAG: hypothetical protein JWO69_849 [Thermoleophilia bacterium]|jgi:hypothetical protein|nr:hypothetical protein [Thermoleophilia bacterium]
MTTPINTGARAGIEPPVYDGYRAVENKVEGLAYDWSPMTKVTGDPYQWITELEAARTQVQAAKSIIAEKLADYRFPSPKKINDVPQGIRDALDAARMTIHPKRLDLGAEKGEVPNYRPDGTKHPKDVEAASLKLWDKPNARMHLETVLFRLPKADVGDMNIAAIDDAHRAAEDFSWAMTYQVENEPKARDIPDMVEARRLLDRMELLIDESLKNRGEQTIDSGVLARIGNRFQQLPTNQRNAVVMGAIALGGALGTSAGVALSNSMKS